MDGPLLRKVDAVTVPVPDLDAGLAFYAEVLGQPLRWRNDEIGQAAVGLPDGDTEIVLVDAFDIPVGRVAVVADPFGNALVLVDLSKGRYVTDVAGAVVEVVGDGTSS
jgi:catechol 2,3-dioxygenase-like lactoylglutathione lyase family enzyme